MKPLKQFEFSVPVPWSSKPVHCTVHSRFAAALFLVVLLAAITLVLLIYVN